MRLTHRAATARGSLSLCILVMALSLRLRRGLRRSRQRHPRLLPRDHHDRASPRAVVAVVVLTSVCWLSSWKIDAGGKDRSRRAVPLSIPDGMVLVMNDVFNRPSVLTGANRAGKEKASPQSLRHHLVAVTRSTSMATGPRLAATASSRHRWSRVGGSQPAVHQAARALRVQLTQSGEEPLLESVVVSLASRSWPAATRPARRCASGLRAVEEGDIERSPTAAEIS